MSYQIKRAYDPAADDDGLRVLVDRLWPRGLRKADAKIDLWLKDIAPSTGLREWFAHDPDKWIEFRRRYRLELEAQHDGEIDTLRQRGARERVTLVYGAKDEKHNQAIVLKAFLEKHG